MNLLLNSHNGHLQARSKALRCVFTKDISIVRELSLQLIVHLVEEEVCVETCLLLWHLA